MPEPAAPDVTDATEWLAAREDIDADRICIVGWSYGAYAAAMGLIQAGDRYQCAAAINGVYNLPLMISDDKDYIGGRVWTRHVGLDGERASAVSPYHQADHIDDPLLIIHADDDGRVKIGQATMFHRRLESRDKDVELVTVPLGGHSMNNEAARAAILDSLEAFLAKHNPGG